MMDRRDLLKKLAAAVPVVGVAAVAAVGADGGTAEAARRPKLPKRGTGVKGTIQDMRPEGGYVIISIIRTTTGRLADLILDKNTKLIISDQKSNVLDLRDTLYSNPEEVIDLYQGGLVEAFQLRGRVAGVVFIDF